MKRHISIFTFLLSVFTAVGLTGSATGAGVHERERGLLTALHRDVNGEFKDDGIDPALVNTPVECDFTASLPSGQKVEDWSFYDDDPTTSHYAKPIKSLGSDNPLHVVVEDASMYYLVAHFAWITYNVKYDANGGSPTPQTMSGKAYNVSFKLAEEGPTKTGFDFSGWKPDTKTDQIYSAGQEVSGVDLCPDDWHEDGKTVTLRAQWKGKAYTVTYRTENCTLTSQPSPGTYDQPLSIAWTKDADVGETSTVTVYDGADTARQILQRMTNTTSFDFKMSDLLGTYYESVVIKVACTKNVRHDLTLKKGVGVKAITWKTNNCAWVRSETDVNLPGLLASTTWAVKVEDVDVERGYDGPSPDSGTMSVDVTRTLRGTPHQYTVDYDLQGGEKKSGGNYPVNESFEDSFYVSAPTKTDQTFLGWIVVTNKDDLACAKWGTSAGDVTHDVLPDTPCANGATGDVFFKNLTSIQGEKIWLEAKWSGQTHKITAIAEPVAAGTVTGAGEIAEGDNVTLTAVVTNMGYSFCCWTNSVTGLSTNANPWTFTVTAAETYTAVFTGNVYTVTFLDIYGGNIPASVAVQVGEQWKSFFPQMTYAGHVLTGWYTSFQYEPGSKIDGDANVMVVPPANTPPNPLYAKWEEIATYTIAYDGNGAMSGTMTNDTALCGVETALTSNKYARTGYDFAGWTNTVKQAFYADGAKVTDLAARGATATLFAVWTPHTYTVTFDRNGGEGTQMTDQPFTYDVEQSLSSNQYTNGKNTFAGWATTSSGEVAYADGAKVMNLTDENGATVQLFAKWEKPSYTNNELSVAADCACESGDDGRQPLYLTAEGEACTATGVEKDCGGNNLAVKMTSEVSATYLRTDTLTGPGTFKFNYKVILKQNRGAKLSVKGVDDAGGFALLSNTNVSDWAEYSAYYNSGTSGAFEWMFEMVPGAQGEPTEYFALIDNIRWIPGEHPEPVDGEDNVDISSAGISADGQSFSLSFQSDERFDYNLLTNANLLINSWGIMEMKEGRGGKITFEPKIIEGQPQLFYKVETIQKK